MQVTCQCGTPLQAVEDALRAQGLTAGHSPQSKPLAQMGAWWRPGASASSRPSTAHRRTWWSPGSRVPQRKICRIKNVARRAAGPRHPTSSSGNEGFLCYITEVTVKISSTSPRTTSSWATASST